MKITGQLKMVFDAKISSITYLKKYDFEHMEYTIDKVSDIDNLIRFLIFRDLEKDTTGTLVEIIKSYINRNYSKFSPMFFSYKLFKFLDYIPDVNTFKSVILASDEIYNYIKNNLYIFSYSKGNDTFRDNMLTAYQIIDFERRKDIPNEVRYLYENVKHTNLLTNKEELEYIKKYIETRDINCRNILILHYQRLIFDRILLYHNKYQIDFEILIDAGNRILYDTINSYNLNYKCSLVNAIKNHFSAYISSLLTDKDKVTTKSYLIKETVPEPVDEIENMLDREEVKNMLNKIGSVVSERSLEELILSIPFNDREIYFLLYGYGLFGFPKISCQVIADNLGVTRAYIYECLQKHVIRKIKKAIILESLKTKKHDLSKEEQKIIRNYKNSFATMQSNSIKRFFESVIELDDEGIFDIERELSNLMREDKTTKDILMKRYNRYDLAFDNSLLATLIVGYASEFIPLTKEEYKYFFESIIPTIRERLNNKASQTLKLKA